MYFTCKFCKKVTDKSINRSFELNFKNIYLFVVQPTIRLKSTGWMYCYDVCDNCFKDILNEYKNMIDERITDD
jgi:hypothetical protein